METGKTLYGTTRLAFDMVEGVTHIVEGMYRNIAATPLPFGRAPEGPAPGIAGLVHEIVRGSNQLIRKTTDLALLPTVEYIDRLYPPGPYRAAIIAALNGVCGDHLACTANPLAIAMRMRVFLPLGADDSEQASSEQNVAFGKLFETQRRPVEVFPSPEAFNEPDFQPSGRLLVLAHGLCMNDMEWTADQHNHGHMLAQEYGYTPVFALYNTGRHISENGSEFADQIAGLIESWPVPVESVTLIGFSMGGLVARSALYQAEQQQADWLQKVDKVVYVGAPHHGSALERGGYWLQKSATFSPYTAPLAALGKVRSDGITDLRHGNIRPADWQYHDEHEDNADHRQPTPLAASIDHYAIGATLSKTPAERLSQLRSDGLVHPASSGGKHRDPAFKLGFDKDSFYLIHDLGHLAMLRDQRVAAKLKEWLAR